MAYDQEILRKFLQNIWMLRLAEDWLSERMCILALGKEKDQARRVHQVQIGQELRHIQQMLLWAYKVNVIPSGYRNIYAAAWLDHWFERHPNGTVEDALLDYSPEAGKQLLEKAWDRAEQILADYSQNAMEDIGSESEAEELCNGKMEEINTAATAYFAAASYFKN